MMLAEAQYLSRVLGRHFVGFYVLIGAGRPTAAISWGIVRCRCYVPAQLERRWPHHTPTGARECERTQDKSVVFCITSE
jgi:hypothetical protein